MLFNAIGVVTLAFVETGYHRSNTEAVQKQEKAGIISLDPSEFSSIAWIGKRDFIWKGEVYDCVSIIRENDKVTIVCHLDTKEKKIKEQLARHFESEEGNNAPAQKKQSKSIFKVMPVFPVFDQANLIIPFLGDTVAMNESNAALPASPYLASGNPPPENC